VGVGVARVESLVEYSVVMQDDGVRFGLCCRLMMTEKCCLDLPRTTREVRSALLYHCPPLTLRLAAFG